MNCRWPSICVLIAGILASGSPCFAQATGQAGPAVQLKLPPYRQRVIGIFDDDTGQPLDGVEVRDLLGGLSATTTTTGTVALYFLPDGGSMVRLRKLGYITQTMPIAISPTDTAPITIMMSHAATLPTVTTTAKATNPAYASPQLRGFEERMKSGIGRYIGYDDIRKDEHLSLSDLLRKLGRMEILTLGTATFATVAGNSASSGGLALQRPAAATGRGGRSGSTVTGPTSAASTGRCTATVFLDGMNIGHPDLSTLESTPNIAGVEWYPTAIETPMEFSATSTGCGVLVIWTRVR